MLPGARKKDSLDDSAQTLVSRTLRDAMPTILRTTKAPTTAHGVDVGAAFAWKCLAWGCGLVLLGTAVWFRLWRLDHVPGVNGDEAWYGVQVMSWLRGEDVAWRTPTGNPMNPFYFAPLAGVHAIWGIGFWQLRSVAAASGVLALIVNFYLARRAFGLDVAMLSTILLAVLPINVAYSRFGWDASQSLLFALPVVYCPLVAMQTPARAWRWLLAGTLSFLAAVLVHPTNVFLLPALLIPVAIKFRFTLIKNCKRVNASSWRFLVYAMGMIVCAALLYLLRHWVAIAAARAISPREFGVFLGRYVDLLSGVTTYRYIPGSLLLGGAWSWSTLSAALLTLAMCGIIGLSIVGWFFQKLQSEPQLQGLLGGFFFTALGFYLVAGPGALAPHFERYGICLLGPAVIVISVGLERLIAKAGERVQILWCAMLVVPACFLISFHGLYFEQFQNTGGQSHRAFRTASEEPKQELIREISLLGSLSGRGSLEGVILATSEWWTYWPLKYLSMDCNDIQVEPWKDEAELTAMVGRRGGSRVYFVEFVEQPALAQVRTRLVQQGREFDETVLNDSAGYPLMATLATKFEADAEK